MKTSGSHTDENYYPLFTHTRITVGVIYCTYLIAVGLYSAQPLVQFVVASNAPT